MSHLSPMFRPMGQAAPAPSPLQNLMVLAGIAALAIALLFYGKKHRLSKNPRRKRKAPKGMKHKGAFFVKAKKPKRRFSAWKAYDNAVWKVRNKLKKKLGRSPSYGDIFEAAPHLKDREESIRRLDKERLEKRLKSKKRPKSHSKRKSPKWRLQTLRFPKKKFSARKALTWARKHKYKAPRYIKDIEEMKNFWSIRQVSPKRFTQMRTMKLKHGVTAIVGQPKR